MTDNFDFLWHPKRYNQIKCCKEKSLFFFFLIIHPIGRSFKLVLFIFLDLKVFFEITNWPFTIYYRRILGKFCPGLEQNDVKFYTKKSN